MRFIGCLRFSYIPELNNHFKAYIDESASLDLPVSYQEFVDPDERELNFNLPVGATQGMASVSLTGGAIYTIPIYSPPGTAGMQPSISLVYNSQAGNGIAGYGWNIAGISAITRVTHTIYHDGTVKNINFDDDRFALDGQRLIKTSVNQLYGADGTSYYPEVFNGSKIISHGITGNGPEWFEVIGTDGSIIEYGRTFNSRLTSQRPDQSTITWFISKITDPNGNYMNFLYDKKPTEINIKEIQFTGNNTTTPVIEAYNSIKFYYREREDKSYVFVSGSGIDQTLLIDHIDIICENKIIKFYKLEYYLDFYSKLNEIKEFGADNKQYNSIVFGYDNCSYFNDVNETPLSDENECILFVDFNNDGLTDVFKGGFGESNDKTWEIHLNKGEDPRFLEESDFNGNWLDNRDYKSLPIDFNGDGFMDILVYSHYTDFGTGDDYFDLDLLHNTGNGFVNYSILDEDAINMFYDDYLNCEIRILDIDGDNKEEFILWAQTEWMDNLNAEIQIYDLGIENGILNAENVIQIVFFDPITPKNIYCLDLNGDSKDEMLLVKNDNNSDIYRFTQSNGGYTKNIIYTSGFPSTYHNIFIGDYNGDGRSDLLTNVKDPQNNTHWNISYWLDGSFLENEIIDILPEEDNSIFYSTGDFNGDGRTDLNFTYNANNGSTTFIKNRAYYSFNNSFKSSSNELSFLYTVQNPNWLNPSQAFPAQLNDFDGDGLSDWGFGLGGSIWYVITKPWVNYNTIKMIANGYNEKTKFSYSTLTNHNIYSTSDQLDYPIRILVYPLKVVQALSNDNGLGDYNTLTYVYKDGILHLLGKGFIGFKEFRTSSSISPIHHVSKFDINLVHYFLQPIESFSFRLAQSFPTLMLNQAQNVNLIKTGFESTNKVFLPWQQLITEKDFSTGNKKTTELSTDNYGNPITQNVKFFDSHSAITESASILTEFQNYWSAPGNIPSKPQTIISTSTRNGQPPVSKTNKIIYNTKGNIESTVDFFGLPKAVTTIYTDYTAVGLPKTTTVLANGVESRAEHVEFESKYRFVTSKTDAEGYVSSSIIEPAFGNDLFITSANEQTISMEYDGFGKIIRQTNSFEVWTKNEIKWLTGDTKKPNVLYYSKSTSNNDVTSIQYYDKLGRILFTARYDPMNQVSLTKRDYNNKGQLVSISEPYFENAEPTQFTTTNFHPHYGYPYNTILPTGVNITKVNPTPDDPGRISSVTNSATGITTYTEIDCTGKQIAASDPGGTLNYTYFSDGQIKEIASPDGSTITMTYDEYGRQRTLNDPDAGSVIYEYDAFAQLIYQKDAENNEFAIEYDKIGRLIDKEGSKGGLVTSEEIHYYPSTSMKGRRGEIDYVQYIDEAGYNTRITNQYNDKAQLTQKTIATDNNTRLFNYLYTYDAKNRLDEYTYPSGYTIKNEYNSENGCLVKVVDKNTNTSIYEPGPYNARGQMIYYGMNNKMLYTTMAYDEYGLPKSRMTGNFYPASNSIQYLETDFDITTGNLKWRKDRNKNLTENFTYDNVHKNRLATWQVQGQMLYNSTYNDANGNILTKTDFTSQGNQYTYGSDAGPHAFTGIVSPLILPAEQHINYNFDNNTSSITNGNLELVYNYGPGENRIKSVLKTNGQVTSTKYYAGSGVDIEVSANGEERWLHYLPGGGLYVCDKDFNQIGMYYILTDYLGSWDKVITSSGTTIEEYSFDPWGRRRNPVSWTYNSVPLCFTFDRGFTGHEMLDDFGLINMNSRMYDPILGRMLSPDNNVTFSNNTQALNRYSYCLNNPLLYSDPSGNTPVLFAMIAYSAIVGGLSSAQNGDGFISGFAQGAATSAIGAGVGAAIGPIAAGNTIWAEMANRGIQAAASGAINYGIDASVNHNAFNWRGWGLNVATSMAFAGLSYQKPIISSPNYTFNGHIWRPGRGYGLSFDIPPGWMLTYETEGLRKYDIPGIEIITTPSGEVVNVRYPGIEHLIGPSLILLGQPMKALKPVGALGSKPGSSLASYTLSKTFPQKFTKVLGKKTGTKIATSVGTNVIGRAVGRFVPYAGWAITAWDVGWYLGENYGPSTWFAPEPPGSEVYDYMRENGMIDE